MIANFVEIYYGKVIRFVSQSAEPLTKSKNFPSGSNAAVVDQATRHGLLEHDAKGELGGSLRGPARRANHRTDRRLPEIDERKSETEFAVRAAKKQGICFGR